MKRGPVVVGKGALAGVMPLLCAGLMAACGADEGNGGARDRGLPGIGTPSAGASGGSSTTPGAPGAQDSFGNAAGNPVGGSSVPGSSAPTDETCAQGMSHAAPVTPTVWLVLDSSGSMDDDFNGPTRWQALRAALMDADGVVATLEHTVRFGMVIYNGPDNGQRQCNAPENINPDPLGNPACACLFGFEPVCCEPACGGTAPPPSTGGDCANLVTVDPALDNYATLDTNFPQVQIGGWTPTDRAVEYVVDNLPIAAGSVLDAQPDPVYVILATDGAPNDRCGGQGGGGGGGRGSGFEPEVAARVVSAVERGVQGGMKMFVISLAGDEPQLRTHLEEVAMLGNTGEAPFEPSTKDDLVATLREIIGNATCQVALDGTVAMGQECAGTVDLNGFELDCNADDGWRLADERTVQLTGSACENFLSSPSLVHAAFPCGVFIPD